MNALFFCLEKKDKIVIDFDKGPTGIKLITIVRVIFQHLNWIVKENEFIQFSFD